MEKYIMTLEEKFSKISNGYKEIEMRAAADFKSYGREKIAGLARKAYRSDVYQVRMYGVFLFGYISDDDAILKFLKEEVSKDENWRVQEILAKSFDEHCKIVGYENSLAIIEEWLSSDNPNTRRAAAEGLRIWTGRAYFKDNPNEAIKLLSRLNGDESEYVRKSVGNALRDISKKYPELVEKELNSWDISNKRVAQVYKLAYRRIKDNDPEGSVTYSV